jgi:excisionase family DNA binding protein
MSSNSYFAIFSVVAAGHYTELLKPSEVARRLGVSRTWLYDAARDGRIPSVRIGGPQGPLRFIPEDLDAWIDRARTAWRPGDSGAATLRRASAER